MRDLDWQGIGAQALKIPLTQWKTLVACIASASVLSAVIIFCTGVAASFLSDSRQQWFQEQGFNYTFLAVCFISATIFQWCWMTALWHNTMRHCLTFLFHAGFWNFAALMLLILLAQGLASSIKALILAASESLLLGHGRGPQISVVGVMFASLGLQAWIFARLMIWPACVVVRRQLCSPITIWHATDGLFWDFVFLSLRVQLPILVVFGILGAVVLLLVRSANLLMALSAGGAIYAIAAMNAAGLLAYFEVIGKREAAAAPAE